MKNTKLLDTETLFDALVSAAAPPGVTAIQDVHADSWEEMPFVSWRVVNNGQFDYGLWQVVLVLNVVALPTDMFRILTHLYGQITLWNVPGEGVVPDLGGVTEVADSSVFDKVFDGLIQGKHLVQYAASFTINIQQM